MKKYLTSPKYAKIFIIVYSVLVGIFVFFVSILSEGKLSVIFIALHMSALLVLGGFIKGKNAFVKFWADDVGLHNSNFTLKWEDIEKYELFEVFFYHNVSIKFQCPSVICFGSPESSKSFPKQSSKKCIFVSIIPEHLELLNSYKGKSDVVDEVVKLYYTTTA